MSRLSPVRGKYSILDFLVEFPEKCYRWEKVTFRTKYTVCRLTASLLPVKNKLYEASKIQGIDLNSITPFQYTS